MARGEGMVLYGARIRYIWCSETTNRTRMAKYKFAKVPAGGEKIEFENDAVRVPDTPVIPFVEGDGSGPDIWRAAVRVFDAAVERAYQVSERSPGWKCSPARNPSSSSRNGCRGKP